MKKPIHCNYLAWVFLCYKNLYGDLNQIPFHFFLNSVIPEPFSKQNL